MKTGKQCMSCPEILTEEYGKGQDKCAKCLQEENSKDWIIIAVGQDRDALIVDCCKKYKETDMCAFSSADDNGVRVPQLESGIYLMHNIKIKFEKIMWSGDDSAGLEDITGSFTKLYQWTDDVKKLLGD